VVAVIGSFAPLRGFKIAMPATPFMDHASIVFLTCIAPGVGLSYLLMPAPEPRIVHLKNVSFATGAGFNVGAAADVAALIAICAYYW